MLINKKHVKEFVKGHAAATRPRFTRVSQEFLDRCDAHLRQYIINQIKSLPSLGKTVK